MLSSFVRAGLLVAGMAVASTSFALAETSATPAAKSTTVAQASPAPPPANFGSAPSGSIPILYNDRHVYAKPDVLKQGRVLAALVMNGTLLIPLRSMFEQMGATVSYDPGTKTSTVTKPGAEIKVTVGKPEVLINGESRPLDVPPIYYQGDVLVPVRVISEGMGAYVQWVPNQQVVVVRYLAPTPPPTAPPTEAPAPPPTPVPAPVATPTPNPLSVWGSLRSYYFTRQNASNNPGAQFNFSSSKYSSTGVNQASLNNSIDIHAQYELPYSGWYVGGSYFFAEPFSGPCSVAPAHAKGKPCVSQTPPNTNPDDTLPGFVLDTFPETYVGYKDGHWAGKGGDFELQTPWAGPYDQTRLKPASYQGVDVSYAFEPGLTLEVGNFWNFQNRTSNNFSSNTLLTSYPAGNPGLASNIFVPGCTSSQCNGINTAGFLYGKLGYAPKDSNYSIDGYLYGVQNILTMYWGDARYTVNQLSYKPYVALQGGWEQNAGNSVIGKVNSSLIGVQIGANATKDLLLQAGFDDVPWQNETVSTAFLSSINWACKNSTYQLVPANGLVTHTLAYFLPTNAGQCLSNATTGTTSIYYGGWASPYTDGYATDPIFTTSISQGMTDRRAPGTSFKVGGTFTSDNKKWLFIATDAWYNYGNALVGQNTNEWDLDGSYRFSPPGKGRYRGLLLRDRYMQRTQTNTFCGVINSNSCAPGATPSSLLGGTPLFKYNRVQVEYDF